MMVLSEGDRLKRVVVSTPGDAYFTVADLAAHNINECPDRANTLQQFGVLRSTMEAFGCEVIDVPELADHPNSVFPRDVVLCTPRGFIKLRMGLEARRGEEAWMARALQLHGASCIGAIEAPGTVEGGDVILAGAVAFVGISRRSNEAGVGALSRMLSDMGYEVRTTPLDERWLHIGGPMSVIGPHRVVCCRGVFPDGFFDGFDVIEVNESGPSTGNVICLRANEVIANAAENAETITELERSGVAVHSLDLSEFRKGAGGPTCLILPVDRV
jgi:dimethylargininase